MSFAKRLKRIRELHGFSQTDLAEQLGVHFVTVSRWERGIAYPSADMLAAIARFFLVSCDYLMCMDYSEL